MRVLFVIGYVPWPPDVGANQRSWALIRGLAQEHGVSLAVPAPESETTRRAVEETFGSLITRFIWITPIPDPVQSPSESGTIARILGNVADFLTNWLPFAFRGASASWGTALDKYRGEFDAVICRHAKLVRATSGLGLRRTVFDLDDLAFLIGWRALKFERRWLHRMRDAIEVLRTWLAEQRISRRAARVLLCSREDARLILSPRKSVIPNGVTLEAGSRVPKERETLVFVGNCAWWPNTEGLRWFIEEVWPAVVAARPQTRFRIVGRAADYATLPFARHDAIQLIPNVPTVKPWFEGAAVSVVPILVAGGTRIKILESLGYGTPVVSTAVGASGLTELFDASTGLYVVDGGAAMAETLCRLLADGAAAVAGAERGARVVARDYTWDAVVKPVVENIETWIGEQ